MSNTHEYKNNVNVLLGRFFAAFLLTFVTIIGSKWAPNLLPYDSSVSDYFRVTRANRIAGERTNPPDITLIMIGEHFINKLPYRSPVDRCVLASGINSILNLDPKLVGIDYLFDKNTEPRKDEMLRKVLTDNQATIVTAVNTTNGANTALPNARATENSFSPKAIQASALLVKDSDYVVRNALLDDDGVLTFAALLAERYMQSSNIQSSNKFQIDWLSRDSGRDEAFPILPIEMFLDPSVNNKCNVHLDVPPASTGQYLRPQIENRIVIIGADLAIEDRHITPFDSVWHEEVALSGAEIHANITQQLIDGRSIGNTPAILTFPVLFMSFLLSLWISAKIDRTKLPHYLVLLGPAVLSAMLSGINWLGIYRFGYVLPTGLVAFAIGANVLLEFTRGWICRIFKKAVDLWSIIFRTSVNNRDSNP